MVEHIKKNDIVEALIPEAKPLGIQNRIQPWFKDNVGTDYPGEEFLQVSAAATQLKRPAGPQGLADMVVPTAVQFTKDFLSAPYQPSVH